MQWQRSSASPSRATQGSTASPASHPAGQAPHNDTNGIVVGRGRTQLVLGASITLAIVVMAVSYPAVRIVAEATGQQIPWLYALLPGGTILVSMLFGVLAGQMGRSWWWPGLPLLLIGVVLLAAMWVVSGPGALLPGVFRVAAVLVPVVLWAVGLSLLDRDRRSPADRIGGTPPPDRMSP